MVFASHQVGAAVAAFGAGVVRDAFGEYTYAWWAGAATCVIAAVLSIVTREPRPVEVAPRAPMPAPRS
ncbi:hypothetical protein [Aestuariimicrobium sp. Y1814]|uniref:hypothetical protein n=1 Tax=Aestuariimicrobium sp. Y1814 TaxID=3418742 RepID=UPI003DA73EA1